MIDEALIIIKAGDGGDGLISFRREKFVPKGGPDGGDGGRGGDVYFECSDQVNTLFDFNRLKRFQAQNGQRGGKNRSSGRSGEDYTLKVPPGTIVIPVTRPGVTADLTQIGQRLRVAKGGRGGWGNWHFATSTRQTPRIASPGGKGEQKTIKLELQLIAQVGLVGLPNVGKSSLLSRISAAKPKIADYPFTTLEPILGVVNPKQWGIDAESFVVADIPGLIEGASKGRGLGDQFLRHIERTKILVHLLDATSSDLKKDYATLRNELAAFDKKLLDKPEVTVINKTDLKTVKHFAKTINISAATGLGIERLINALARVLTSQLGSL